MTLNNRAYTIVEFLIAMTLGLVVLGALYAVFNMQNKQLGNQEQLSMLEKNAGIAVEMMVREIQMAGYNQTTNPATIPAVSRCTGAATPSNAPCAGITNAAANTISFVADLNGNGSTTAGSANPNENITYNLDTYSGIQALGRISNGTKQRVVPYVDALTFLYYDGSGNITANLNDIQGVKITIRLRTEKQDPSYTDATYGDHYRHYTLSSFVVLRNLAL